MNTRVITTIGGISLVLLCMYGALAAPDDWAEGAPGNDDGANHTYYNRRGQLPWRNREGDWCDADGVSQGPKPFAVAVTSSKSTTVEWDVTELVRGWVSGKLPPKGILLRNTQTSGGSLFHSREADDAAHRPQLKLVVGGDPQTLTASADTYLDRSTYRALGNNQQLRADGTLPALIRFNVSSLKASDPIEKATLQLTMSKLIKAGEIGVFACDQGEVVPSQTPLLGLAASYPGDVGIGRDPDCLFATGFESPEWQQEWTLAGGKVDTVDADPATKFEPLDGKACRGHLAKGDSTAMNMTYQFQKKLGAEPEEIYFRYYLRFGDDWNQTLQGGKMPGISGTYNRAGWGGRKVNGKDGWSARGSFSLTFPEGNPLAGKQSLGWYCYHADMEGFYGNVWIWTKGYRGFLDNNRWYCVEEYVKLNTPGTAGATGARDGILRAWIDGYPAFEKTDIRFRDVDSLKIEQIWMNVYHGGTVPSPRDQHLYIDNVVVARKYIGPLAPKSE